MADFTYFPRDAGFGHHVNLQCVKHRQMLQAVATVEQDLPWLNVPGRALCRAVKDTHSGEGRERLGRRQDYRRMLVTVSGLDADFNDVPLLEVVHWLAKFRVHRFVRDAVEPFGAFLADRYRAFWIHFDWLRYPLWNKADDAIAPLYANGVRSFENQVENFTKDWPGFCNGKRAVECLSSCLHAKVTKIT